MSIDLTSAWTGEGARPYTIRYLGRLFAGRLRKQDLKHQQPRAYHNRAVGHIEGWPLVWAYIEEEKIHHVPADEAVPQIADRASQNQRQPDSS